MAGPRVGEGISCLVVAAAQVAMPSKQQSACPRVSTTLSPRFHQLECIAKMAHFIESHWIPADNPCVSRPTRLLLLSDHTRPLNPRKQRHGKIPPRTQQHTRLPSQQWTLRSWETPENNVQQTVHSRCVSYPQGHAPFTSLRLASLLHSHRYLEAP